MIRNFVPRIGPKSIQHMVLTVYIISIIYMYCVGIRDSTGVIQTSSTNSSRLDWRYNSDSCVDNYEDFILTENIFSLYLTKNNSIIYNISEFSLYLPQRFDFYIPPEMRSDEYSLRIGLCDQTLTDQDIPIIILTSNLYVGTKCIYLIETAIFAVPNIA